MNVVDRRRRLAPSNAFAMVFDQTNSGADETPMEIDIDNVNEGKFFVNLSHIPSAIGSCYLQSNQNIISVSVYGPRPSFTKVFNSQAQLKINIHPNPYLKIDKVIEKSTILQTLESAFSNLILLDQYPKSNIDIFVNIISISSDICDVSLLSLIHNTVNMAIVDSGIGIKSLPACGVSINKETKTKLLINSIHTNNFTNDSLENVDNEELLVLYCPSLGNSNELKGSLSDAIKDAKKLRLELSSLYLKSL